MGALRRLVMSSAAGLTLAVAFPDIGWWWAAPLALGMLYLLFRAMTPRQAFGYGWIAGISFFLPHLWWAYVAVGAVPWIALSAAEAVAVALTGWAFALVHSRVALKSLRAFEPLAFAVLWVAAELLRSAFPFGGFPWGRLAFAMADAPLVGLAWLGGAPLVSLAVALLGALGGQTLVALRNRQVVQVFAAPVFGLVILMSGWVIPLDARAQSGTLTVGWAQGNVENAGLDSFSNAREVTGNHRDATVELAQSLSAGDIVLMVWPENASDIDPRFDSQTARAVSQAAAAVNAPVLLGTVDYTPANARYNLSLVWLPDGTQLEGQEYRKQVPAPFAEYIPLRSFARLFSEDVDRVTRDMLPGTAPARLSIPIQSLSRDVVVGPIICFEVAYDWISRQAVNEGAEFLAVQTNNATFGITPESTQQLAMSRLRAVETGRATLQVSTVGVTAVIAPDGEVLDSTELFTQDAGIAEIPLRTELSPASRFGGAVEGALAIAGALLVLIALGTPRQRSKR